jgi:hypothetical protein
MAKAIVHTTASFATCQDLCNEATETGKPPLCGFLFGTECLMPRFVLRWLGTALLRCTPWAAWLCQEDTARGKRGGCCITKALVVEASSPGAPESAYKTLCHSADEVLCHGMGFVLPRYVAWCAVASGGRWTRRSVPAMRQSTDTQRARVCARFCGSLAGNAGAVPHALCKPGRR